LGVCKARQVHIDLRKVFLEFLGSLDYRARQAFQGYLGSQGTEGTQDPGQIRAFPENKE